MYKEFRELSRADAVKSLYQDMAARHRARFRSIHVCCIAISPLNNSRLMVVFRSFGWLRSRRLRKFVAPTSNNSWCPDSSSPCPTVSSKHGRPSSPTAQAHSKRLDRVCPSLTLGFMGCFGSTAVSAVYSLTTLYTYDLGNHDFTLYDPASDLLLVHEYYWRAFRSSYRLLNKSHRNPS